MGRDGRTRRVSRWQSNGSPEISNDIGWPRYGGPRAGFAIVTHDPTLIKQTWTDEGRGKCSSLRSFVGSGARSRRYHDRTGFRFLPVQVAQASLRLWFGQAGGLRHPKRQRRPIPCRQSRVQRRPLASAPSAFRKTQPFAITSGWQQHLIDRLIICSVEWIDERDALQREAILQIFGKQVRHARTSGRGP